MTERKFTRGLNKPGMAAHLRESVSQVVRESSVMNKANFVEPIDVENFLAKNKTLIKNDPQRELLIYPNDDISEIIMPRQLRVSTKSIVERFDPPNAKILYSTEDGKTSSTYSEASECLDSRIENQNYSFKSGVNYDSNNRNNLAVPSRSSLTPTTLNFQHVDSSSGAFINYCKNNEVPDFQSECTRFTRQALYSYHSKNYIIQYKYSPYGGTCSDLPKTIPSENLRDEIYEIDVDVDLIDEQMSKSQADSITKKGYLYKGPDSGSDRIFANIGSKSFKRRYCYLRHEVDGTYILELHKDEKQGDCKATIFMDFCKEISHIPKRGRFCFEVQMTAGHKSFTLAAENEDDFKDWLSKLSLVLQQNKLQEEKRKISLEQKSVNLTSNVTYGTLKGLDQSMNPQLIKYARETDISIAQARRESRQRLFSFPKTSMESTTCDNVSQYCEHFGKRVFIACKSLRFRLKCPDVNAIDDKSSAYQVEPYITSLALFDSKSSRKISENFYFNINDDKAYKMLPNTPVPESVVLSVVPKCAANEEKTLRISKAPYSLIDDISSDLQHLLKDRFDYMKQCIFSITAPHPEIYLVLKIEKILQGNVVQTTEPYLKAGRDPKLGLKVYKTVCNFAQNIGHYRQPFAWAAKPLFKIYSNELDTESNEFVFNTIYRQETQKLRDEELIKILAEYRKPDKLNKFTVIPGYLKMDIKFVDKVNGSLDKSLNPLIDLSLEEKEPTLEVTEFHKNSGVDTYPFVSFYNHIFIYPMSLQFDSQRLFTRARNITVVVEFRESDGENSKPLKCIYGRPGQDFLVSQIACPVLHHNTTPTWYEEIKMRLPLGLFPEHHILFSFFHVSCNLKKRDGISTFETPIGYAWLPLLQKGRINVEEQIIPVAAVLPVGYLSIQPLGLGKGNCGPEVHWIDNQRPVFTVGLRLDSTVLTADQHLQNFFSHSERLLEGGMLSALPAESETCRILKASNAINMSSLLNFLPTLLNELFTLLVHSRSDEVGLNIIHLLTNIIHMVVEDAKRKELLCSYIKYVFHTTYYSQKSLRTVHGELTKYLPTLLNPNNTDFLIINKFMRYSSIFFDLIIKSMAQYLLHTGRIRMLRKERFPKDYSNKLQHLIKTLIPYIMKRYKDLTEEVEQLNKSLASFIRRCLTYMDRGFVFQLIRYYMEQFSPGDSRILHELKLNFLYEICLHEHYVSFNLPIIVNPKNRLTELLQHFSLSDEFCRQHYLSGLLLQEVKGSLNQIGSIRRHGLDILKNLLAKHEYDNRYQNPGQLSRIALLYVPWLGIVMENVHRIEDQLDNFSPNSHIYSDSASCTKRWSCSSSYVFNKEITFNSITSTPRLKNRMTFHYEQPSPGRNSLNTKETNFLAAIAGKAVENGTSYSSLNSLNSSESQKLQNPSTREILPNGDDNVTLRSHNRSVSVTQTTLTPRYDKFTSSESKDLLFGFVFVIKHMSQDQMIGFMENCNETEMLQFILVLDLCLFHFRYVGKKNVNIKLDSHSTQYVKANTLPTRICPSLEESLNIHESGTLNFSPNRGSFLDESVRNQRALYESNLATEIGMVVLDCLGLYIVHFRQMLADSTVLPSLARVYLRFLQLGQSVRLSEHVFAALRSFINNFSCALFKGNAVLCGQMVHELLKACDSRLVQIRHEACAVLYLLMRSNFESSGRKGLTRVHLQVIISVSQMIGNVIGLNNARFQESLSLINSYANSDKAMKDTGFLVEVKDLTRRVRTVLMATAQMQANQMDPERLLELQYSLANSYASTPELRHTWLITMARNHEQSGNYSEAACCHLHIAALMGEYLQLRGIYNIKWGATAFANISRNIPIDEQGLKLDSGAQDSQYNEQMLLDQLKQCAEFLYRAERFECLGELYKLILPIYERSRNYFELANSYEHLYQAYNKIIEANRSGKRILGRFYRVVFYGMIFFEEDHNIEYIYKEPKLTSLSEISERLAKQYMDKFGNDLVKLIMDSSPVNVDELDPKIAYIQVTHVIPFFTKEEFDQRLNDFEQNHDVDTFMYETPFTKSGSAHGSIEDQWKRKTVIKTKYSFPYVLKRIPVNSREIIELSPIEVAIDEMQAKVSELEEVIMPPPDIKKLQLRLQGSVAATVNAGPLAYAQTFLDPKIVNNFSMDRVEDLKDIFRDFICVCHKALLLNERMISADQKEYHNALRENYEKLCQALSDLLKEAFHSLSDSAEIVHRNSVALFNAISGASNNSSTA